VRCALASFSTSTHATLDEGGAQSHISRDLCNVVVIDAQRFSSFLSSLSFTTLHSSRWRSLSS
jgi:hypothetical protein